MHPHVYFGGKILPASEAKIPLGAHSVQYGSSCFTGMRGIVEGEKVRLFRLRSHFERLKRSVQIMDWEWNMTFEEFEKAVRDLILVNGPEGNFYLRANILTLTEKLHLDHRDLDFQLCMYLVPFGSIFDPERGMNLKISSWQKYADQAIPTKAKAGGAYLNSGLAATEVRKEGFDDAILLNERGHVAELSGANLIIVHKGEVIIPPVSCGALDGITLDSAMKLLEEENVPFSIQPIEKSMLLAADEVIVMGTATEIQFAQSIDGRTISEKPGNITTLLRKRFDAIHEMRDEKSQEWITEIGNVKCLL